MDRQAQFWLDWWLVMEGGCLLQGHHRVTRGPVLASGAFRCLVVRWDERGAHGNGR